MKSDYHTCLVHKYDSRTSFTQFLGGICFGEGLGDFRGQQKTARGRFFVVTDYSAYIGSSLVELS